MNKIEHYLLQPILDQEGKFIKVPKYAKNIKIDVGLSHTAVNSILWINNPELEDRHIFGFEPQPHLNPYAGVDKSRYTLVKCGLDNIERGIQSSMYICGEDPGRSSLYVPNTFKPIYEQIVFLLPFDMFLSKIDWHRFQYIEHLKTDTQGNDLRILMSAKEYLQKIVFLEVESTCYENEYEYYPKKKETQEYLEFMGFELLEETNSIDQSYINKRYLRESLKLDNSRVL